MEGNIGRIVTLVAVFLLAVTGGWLGAAIGNSGAESAPVAGPQGMDGSPGQDGADGRDGADGVPGPRGRSGAIGPQGPAGPAGGQGVPGEDGEPGSDGADGLSAYDLATLGGFVGTESDWLASLVGPQGDLGPIGPQGPAGPAGAQGPAGPQGTSAPGFGLLITLSGDSATVASNPQNVNVTVTRHVDGNDQPVAGTWQVNFGAGTLGSTSFATYTITPWSNTGHPRVVSIPVMTQGGSGAGQIIVDFYNVSGTLADPTNGFYLQVVRGS